MSAATLDEDTLETVNALQHQLEEEGEIEIDELEEESVEEEPANRMAESTVEEEIEEEIPSQISGEEKHPADEHTADDPKKSSGSFFDQFD